MKLTSIEIHPSGSADVAVLSFRDPAFRNEFSIKGITGLDADQIVPRAYKGSGNSKFNTMSLEGREVVIRIGLNPRFDSYESFSGLRDKLYRIISSSRTGKVQLIFKEGSDVIAALTGFVSKMEAPLFEKTQEVQITFTPDEPMLRALEPVMLEIGR